MPWGGRLQQRRWWCLMVVVHVPVASTVGRCALCRRLQGWRFLSRHLPGLSWWRQVPVSSSVVVREGRSSGVSVASWMLKSVVGVVTASVRHPLLVVQSEGVC